MTKFQFAGTRAKACVHTVNVESGGSTTAASAGEWKFYLQFRNRAGYSLFSDPVAFTLAAGQKVSITIPADARRGGEHIEEWVIAGTNLSPYNVDARVLAAIPAFDALGNPTPLPYTVTFSHDDHFKIEASVANDAALPTNKLPGMRRGTNDSGQIKTWNSIEQTWDIVIPPRFTSYVPSAEGLGGSNRDIGLLPDDFQGVLFPDYDSGYSLPVRGRAIGYWLVNDTDFDVPLGTPIEFTFRAGRYLDWQNKILITPKGFADIATGHLDRTGEGGVGLYDGIDQDFEYQKLAGEIILEKNLPPGRAYYFEITPQFSDTQLGNLVLQGQILTCYAKFGEESSTYAPGTQGLGSYIYPEPASRKRIYPSIGHLIAEASPGAGLVKQREFRKSGSEIIIGFAANTANQQVLVTSDGHCLVAASVPPYAVRRAIVGTVDGVGLPTAYQYNLAVDAGKVIRLNITHPTTIRSNYPDVVAGSNLGDFNASKVYVYVRNLSSGAILQYVQDITPGSQSSSFAIGGLPGTTVTSLPAPSNSFGLYTPTSFTATTENVSGFLPAANVEVAIAYYFENTVTSLNHTDGCIAELPSGGVVEYLDAIATGAGSSNITPEDILILSFAF